MGRKCIHTRQRCGEACIRTTFVSKEDMKSYAKIPEYGKLFKISLPIADDVAVADYWVNKEIIQSNFKTDV